MRKRAVIWPFCSQQNKVKKEFRLESDSGVKHLNYIAERLVGDGWHVDNVRPHVTVPAPHGNTIYVYMPLDNLHRRLYWNPEQILQVCTGADLIVCMNEFLAYPMRCLLPEAKILLESAILPNVAWPATIGLFPLALNAAMHVYCTSETLREFASKYNSSAFVCPFAFDERDAYTYPQEPRDIDVLFNQRVSATGYTNAQCVLEAASQSPYVWMFTDPTGYLRTCGHPTVERSHAEYLQILRRSQIVVGLTDNGYGGNSIREAIYAGCCPVVLRCRGYYELLGGDWPYYIDKPKAAYVNAAVARAMTSGLWSGVDAAKKLEVHERVRAESYQSAWQRLSRELKL